MNMANCKKTMLAFVVVCLVSSMFIFNVPEAAALDTGITRVQGPTGTSGVSGTPFDLASTPQVGNLLIAVVSASASYGPFDPNFAISETNVVWTQLKVSSTASPNYVACAIFAGAVSAGASKTVTATFAGDGGIIFVSEYSGVLLASYVDQTAAYPNASATTNGYTGETVYTESPIELQVGAIVAAASGVVITQSSPTNGFSMLYGTGESQTVGTGSFTRQSLSFLEKTVSATCTAYSNVTLAANSYTAGCIVTFKGSMVAPYTYTFHGVYNETTGDWIGVCNATAYFDGAAAETFEITTTTVAAFSANLEYISYALLPYPREYWVDPLGSSTKELYVYNDETSQYYISFLDYTGILKDYQYVSAQMNVGGDLVTVEQRKVDAQNMVAMNLVNGRKYQITITGENVSYTYGDLLVDGVAGIQLILRSVDFPSGTLLTQKYTHIYGVRNFTSPSGITVVYEDEQNLTDSVDIAFTFINGTVAYSTSSTDQTFVITWNGAANDTTYYLSATIHHSTYGDLPFRQTFPQQGGTTAPWSLSWMGSLSFNTAYILPALIILFAAGCFSALNAEVGAILTCIVAIILAWMGWIPIPAGALVAATFFAFLMALIYNKRRVVIY